MKFRMISKSESAVAAGSASAALRIEPKCPALLLAIHPAALASWWEPSIVSVELKQDDRIDLTEGDPAPGPVFVSARGPVPFIDFPCLTPQTFVDCTVHNDHAVAANVRVTAYLLQLTPQEFAQYEADAAYRREIRRYVADLFR